MSKETVLVTGGAGYIGSHAALALMTEGYEVVVLDNLSTSTKTMSPKGAKFVLGNIADKPLVTALLRRANIKTLLHFAAFVDVAESVRRPDKYLQNNYHNTQQLIAAAKAADVERFIFSSTAAVYGNPDQVPVPERAPLNPVSAYGQSKALAEGAVQGSGMQYAILRYFNVAGAHQRKLAGYRIDKEPTHLIRKAVRVALGDYPKLDVYGTDYPTPDGSAVRDYVHVSDLVQAHIDVLHYLQRGGQSDTFNVGYGKGYSVLEVVDTIERVAQCRIKVNYTDRREGDSMMIVADSSKLRGATTWSPKHASLDAMILDELQWVKSQKAPAQ